MARAWCDQADSCCRAVLSPFSHRTTRSVRARGAKRHTVWRRRPLLRQGGDGGGGGLPIAAAAHEARLSTRPINAKAQAGHFAKGWTLD